MNIKSMTKEEYMSSSNALFKFYGLQNASSFSRKTINDRNHNFYDIYIIRYKQFWKPSRKIKYRRTILDAKVCSYDSESINYKHQQSQEGLFLSFVLKDNNIPEIPL